MHQLTNELALANGTFILAGTVAPEGAVTAPPGSKYHRTNGTEFRKVSGTGNTGWVELATGGASTPFFDIRDYGATTGMLNNEAAVQSAIDAAETAGGGRVWIPQGVWNTGPLILANRVWLEGAGMFASQLKLVNGANATFVTLRQFVSGVSANAQFTGILNLTLDCNGANQTAGEGIYLAQTPAFGQAATDAFTDPRHLIQNVMIHRAKTNGFTAQNGRSETRLVNVHAFYCGGYGFNPGPDSSLEYCNAGACGAQGFLINLSSIRLSGCKAFFMGDAVGGGTGTLGIGFHLSGARGVHITNCEAQDCKAEGLVIDNYAWNNNVSMVLDSNSKRGVGLHAGFKLGPSYGNILSLTCYERNDPANGLYGQQNAIQFATAGDGFNNNIQLTHFRGSGAVTLGPAVHPIGNTVNELSGNTLTVNNQCGIQTVPYAATITPDPYLGGAVTVTLTGNTTIAATTSHHAGTEMSFIFRQDATGGRTVTWNAQYRVVWTPNTTANRINRISFLFDGSKWIQTAVVVGMT